MQARAARARRRTGGPTRPIAHLGGAGNAKTTQIPINIGVNSIANRQEIGVRRRPCIIKNSLVGTSSNYAASNDSAFRRGQAAGKLVYSDWSNQLHIRRSL